MNIYGKEVHGKADLRSLSSLPELKYDSEGGQLQVLNKILKLQERVTSVVEVSFAHCYPLPRSWGILVDHWSTISSLLLIFQK